MLQKKVGLICNYVWNKHHLYESYYNSIINIYDSVKIIKNINDLDDIKTLVIGDEHFIPHRDIWKNIDFINRCNNLNIKVVIFNNERIMDSFFPWNVENQEYVNKFNDVFQYVSDIDDVIKLDKKLNRMPPSKYFNNIRDSIDVDKKIDKVIFIGNTVGDSYKERRKLLNEVNKIITVDIIASNKNDSWENYIRKLSEYKYVLSPLGNAHFFTMRFYEILLVKSIPIQQVKHNTLDFYDIESKYDDCIFFQDVSELKDKINNFKPKSSHNMLWLEDNMARLLKKDSLFYEFYGESNEDKIIFEKIYNKNPHYNGTYIEVGGYNGVKFSNTKFFEDTFNWSGVLIEPVKKLYNQMVINRPNNDCYNYAINETEGEVDFIGENATSGIINKMTEKFKKTWHKSNAVIYKVKSIPINKLIDINKYPKIDLFSIDVEGSELGILNTFDWNIKVHLILIEISDFTNASYDAHNIRNGYYNRYKDSECRNILLKKGFELVTRIMGNELWENKNFKNK